MYRTILVILAAAAGLAVSVAACGAVTQQSTASAGAAPSPAAARPASTAAASVTGHAASSTGSLRLLTEPAAGIAPIYQLPVPIGWVAVGDPVRIFPSAQHEQIWAIQEALDFPGTVYGVTRDTPATEWMSRQSAWFAAHLNDRVVGDHPHPPDA